MIQDTILDAVIARAPVTITYPATDGSGMLSMRTIVPTAVRRCRNGNTIVAAFDLHRQEPRSFTMRKVRAAQIGSLV
jgi:predicted DNA-binding transcriptional regulator YafY